MAKSLPDIIYDKNKVTPIIDARTSFYNIPFYKDEEFFASNENYVWNKVCEFSLQSQTPSRFLWRDYTIEQGVTYKYSVQQYNDYGLYSDRILSKPVVADFEDAFLSDGVRQLKIRYNPKVSSFKTDILESKSETIGSKHPFIFRNGNVYYKEFPISGLISYSMDNNHLFLS